MPGTGRALVRLAGGLLLLVLLSAISQAQDPQDQDERSGSVIEKAGDQPALVSADEIVYDEDLGIVTASGNVEVSQENRTLFADAISYNLRTRVVTATGNVSLVDEDGNAYFAEYVELSDDLKEGFIREVSMLMTDRTRLAAASGTRRDGNITEFRKGVFSPCDLCREDPTRAPLWQLKASRVIHDKEEREIRYYNAWMEVFGVPVAYTPYLEHPDPTVDRKSGILAPTFGNSSILGTTVQVPYFWNIAPDKDATFSPIYTSKQGIVLAGEYRQLFTNGRIDVRGSGTFADRDTGDEIQSNEPRGHIDARGRFDINEDWRWGFDVDRASDDTYLRLYDFSSERSLTSNLYAESLVGRDYMSAGLSVYQGLRARDRNEEFPIVAPLLDYKHVSEPDSWGGRTTFDANLAILTRIEGRDTQRLSLSGGWELPFAGPWGDLYRVIANVQADGYLFNEFDPDTSDVNPPGSSESGATGRIFPQIALRWRYPLIRPSPAITQVVEPIVQIVAAPNWTNNDDIPNEDSLDFEFDDTNLFSLNRFPGLDRVDPGSRVDYGLKYTVSNPTFGQTSAFVGQSYRLKHDDAFSDGSGLEDDLSDVVGRLRLQPHRDIDLSYRFRLSKDNLSSQRNEIDLRIGPPALRLDLDYTFINSEAGTGDFRDREEIGLRISSRFNKNWSAFVRHKRDIRADESRLTSLGVTFKNECCLIELGGERKFFQDRELDEEDRIFVRIVLKHLGEIGTR